MIVREAAESDLPAIVGIYNVSMGDLMSTTNVEPVTVTRSKGWFRQHKAAGMPVWVAEEGGKVIGWLSIRPFYRRPAYDATAKVVVYVDPESRGKGVGKELVKCAVSYGQSAGISRLVGYVMAHNMPGCMLLKCCGFEKWGILPGVANVGGMERDLVVMGCKIYP